VLLVCGRFVSATPLAELAERFLVDDVRAEELPPSYNVAPTDPVYGIAEHEGKRAIGTFRWGLVPPGGQGPRPINARAETLLERPLFREAFARRRCLLPADGFYEWQARAGKKQPYLISPRHDGVLALAGLWSRHGDERTCAIITTEANGVVGQLHERMPVILPGDHWEQWLDRTEHDVAQLGSLLLPAPDDLLQVHPVSSAVNSVRNNGPELVRPIVDEGGRT
jgi:putative SOS response-associated peptidase YedK